MRSAATRNFSPPCMPLASGLQSELRERHRGPVIAPGDDRFDGARATFNGIVDRRPEVVVRPLDAADVVTAVRFARERDLPVSIRGGGHGVAGHCVGDGSVAVDLRLMRQVVVDPKKRTATCGGGALWDDLDPPCQVHGLATPGGTFGDTGVAGLTLGGGLGHLSPSLGLTLDNLLAATVVTGDGTLVSASEEENPELFWALRGGGGNFGVVTQFTFSCIRWDCSSAVRSISATRTRRLPSRAGGTRWRTRPTGSRASGRSTEAP